MCSGGIVLCLATIRCVQSRTDPSKRKCACDYHTQREYRDILYFLFSFLSTLLYIGFSGDTRLLPTISRLFADYYATALRLFRACAGSRAGICVQFRRGRAACLGGRSGSRNAGRPRAALARRAAGSAEDLRARARIWAGDIKAAREIPLFAPELPFKRTFVLYGYTDIPSI